MFRFAMGGPALFYFTTFAPIFHCDAKPFALGTFASPNAKDSTFASPNARDTNMLVFLYMVSSRHNRWVLCPLVPEGIIKFSVMPAGMKFRFSHELLHTFP